MNRTGYKHLLETEYPAVRRVMQEDLQQLNDDELEDLLTEMFPGTEADDIENFMRTLQNFGKQAAPVAKKALPGIVQGAAKGGSVAGPWGALIGAVGGGAASLLSPSKRATPSVRPAQVPTGQVPAVIPGAAPVQGSTTGAPALPQLLMLLSRPETMRALSSLLMSSSGRSTVQVGNQQVPALAFANAISEIAAEAVESFGTPLEDGISDYLLDTQGNPRIDVFNPAERAALLLADLVSVAASEAAAEARFETEEADFDEVIEDAWIEWDDPLDTYESALIGEEGYDD